MVFMMDSWWNPSVEYQAMDRIHRLGQKRPVKVVKLVVEDSIEDQVSGHVFGLVSLRWLLSPCSATPSSIPPSPSVPPPLFRPRFSFLHTVLDSPFALFLCPFAPLPAPFALLLYHPLTPCRSSSCSTRNSP